MLAVQYDGSNGGDVISLLAAVMVSDDGNVLDFMNHQESDQYQCPTGHYIVYLDYTSQAANSYDIRAIVSPAKFEDQYWILPQPTPPAP